MNKLQPVDNRILARHRVLLRRGFNDNLTIHLLFARKAYFVGGEIDEKIDIEPSNIRRYLAAGYLKEISHNKYKISETIFKNHKNEEYV